MQSVEIPPKEPTSPFIGMTFTCKGRQYTITSISSGPLSIAPESFETYHVTQADTAKPFFLRLSARFSTQSHLFDPLQESTTPTILTDPLTHEFNVLQEISNYPGSLQCFGSLALNDISGSSRFGLLIDSFTSLEDYLSTHQQSDLETRVHLGASIISSFMCFEYSNITWTGETTLSHFGVKADQTTVCITSGFDLCEITQRLPLSAEEAAQKQHESSLLGYSYRKNSSQIKVIIFGVLLESEDLYKRYATPFTAQTVVEREVAKHEEMKAAFLNFPGGVQRIFADPSLTTLITFLSFLASTIHPDSPVEAVAHIPKVVAFASNLVVYNTGVGSVRPQHQIVEIEMQSVRKPSRKDIEVSHGFSCNLNSNGDEQRSRSGSSDNNSSYYEDNSRRNSDRIVSKKALSDKLLVKPKRTLSIIEPATPLIPETRVWQVLIVLAASFLITGILFGCFFKVTRKVQVVAAMCDDPNCASCDKNSDGCTSCQNGYILDAMTQVCTNSCAVSNCSTCLTNYRVCETCATGYILALSQCVLIADSCPISNCSSCFDLQCLTCNFGYDLNYTTGVCEKKCGVIACQTCNIADPQKCNVCAAHYQLDSTSKCVPI